MTDPNKIPTPGPNCPPVPPARRRQLFLYLIISLLLFTCTDSQKTQAQLAAEERIKKISQESGQTVEQLEQVGIELDEIHRHCMREVRQDDASFIPERQRELLQQCLKRDAESYITAKGIAPESMNDLKQAHIILQWELKYFQKRQPTELSLLQKVFFDGMEQIFECRAAIKQLPAQTAADWKRSREKCGEDRFYKICAAADLSEADCGKIISMGLDYNWKFPKVNVKQVLNPTKNP